MTISGAESLSICTPLLQDALLDPQQLIPQGISPSEDMSASVGASSPTARPLPQLPAYIRALPSRFEDEDVRYLSQKGALITPSDPLRNELLQRYFEFMHPFMPILDWTNFVDAIDSNGGAQPVSLLLFQAVMFTGVAFCDLRFLEAAGYRSRREARRAFYNRARLLYDLDYEEDPIALLQALLLMTYWRENLNGRKETHHWIEVAVSLALKIRLHHDPAGQVKKPARVRLYKRIWWAVYMRDSEIALGSRSATCIKDVDFDVPLLELADFELETTPNGNSNKLRPLAIMCIAKAKLSLRISHILSMHHGCLKAKGSIRTAAMLFSSPPHGQNAEVIVKSLEEWREDLLPQARYTPPSLLDDSPGESCLAVNRAFLHMLYYTALSALHRPFLLPTGSEPPHANWSNEMTLSLNSVQLAADSMTEIASALQCQGLVRYLPPSMITVLLPAIVSHLLNIFDNKRHVPSTGLQSFNKCMEIMNELRNAYAAADYSLVFLHRAIMTTEIGPSPAAMDGAADDCSPRTASQHDRGDGPSYTSPSASISKGSEVATAPSREHNAAARVAKQRNGTATRQKNFQGMGNCPNELVSTNLDPIQDQHRDNNRQLASTASLVDGLYVEVSDGMSCPSSGIGVPLTTLVTENQLGTLESGVEHGPVTLSTPEVALDAQFVNGSHTDHGRNESLGLNLEWMQWHVSEWYQHT